MPSGSLSRRLVVFVTLPVLVALALGWFWLDEPQLFLKEGRTVETCSVLLLVQAVAAWFVVRGRRGWRDWQVPAILGLFALREMDLDKRLTDSGLLKLRTYTGDAPLDEQLLGAGVILFALGAIRRLLLRHAADWWRDLRAGRPHAVAVLAAAVLGVAGKTLDGLTRKLSDLGIVLPLHLDARAGAAEEWLELAAWWLLALAVALLPAAGGPRGALAGSSAGPLRHPVAPCRAGR